MTITYEVIQDTVLTGTSSIGIGASAEVTIRDAESGALVSLFEDRLGASGESNPFNADASGQFRVYAAPGRLQITVVHNAVTRIWEDFQLIAQPPLENLIINPTARVQQRATAIAATAIDGGKANAGFGEADRGLGFITGTATVGTFRGLTGAAVAGSNGFAFFFASVSIGSGGKMSLLYRIEAKDVARLKGRLGSFACECFHDVGSAKNITVYIRDADVADVFSAVTAISNKVVSVPNVTATRVIFEAIDFSGANPERGIEIEIELDCGSITTKQFQISELLFVEGPEAPPFEHRPYGQEFVLSRQYYRRDGFGIIGQAAGTANVTFGIMYSPPMRTTPTISLLDTTPTFFEVGVGSSTPSASTLTTSTKDKYGMHGNIGTGFTITNQSVLLGNQADIIESDAEL